LIENTIANMKYILLIVCLAFATTACNRQSKAPDAAPHQPAAPSSSISGKVTETLIASGYTYIQVNTGTQLVWAAAPSFDVNIGDSVVIGDAMPMHDYHSKTLNRDFDLVYFTGDVRINGKSFASASAHGELPDGHPPILGAAKSEIDFSGIKKAAGGKTVGEIHAEKSELKGKPIALRGKVVRYNAMILGKNWLRIQDGTGSPGTDELVVTTDQAVKVGDTVLVTGSVTTDKDLGSNYKYSVLIEDAKVVVE
jgi:hypothetical protein